MKCITELIAVSIIPPQIISLAFGVESNVDILKILCKFGI